MAKRIRSKRRSRGGGPPRGSRRTSRYEPYGPKPTMVKDPVDENTMDELQRLNEVEKQKAEAAANAHLVNMSAMNPPGASTLPNMFASKDAEEAISHKLLNQYSKVINDFNEHLHKSPLERTACPPLLLQNKARLLRQNTDTNPNSIFAAETIEICLEWVESPITYKLQQNLEVDPFPKEFVQPLIDKLSQLHNRPEMAPIIETSTRSFGSSDDPYAKFTAPSNVDTDEIRARMQYAQRGIRMGTTHAIKTSKHGIQDAFSSMGTRILTAVETGTEIIGRIPTIMKPVLFTAASKIGFGMDINPGNFVTDQYTLIKDREESYNLKLSLLLWCKMAIESYREGSMEEEDDSQKITDSLTLLENIINTVKDLAICAGEVLVPGSDRAASPYKKSEKKKSTKKKKPSKKKKAKKKVTVKKPAKKKNVTKKKKKKKNK